MHGRTREEDTHSVDGVDVLKGNTKDSSTRQRNFDQERASEQKFDARLG
jgi:hypothetical protein